MSYIATIDGYLSFSDRASFETAREYLQEHGYAEKVNINSEAMLIVIEYRVYRNLGRNLADLRDAAADANIVIESNEVDWHGYVETEADSKQFNMREWAAEHGFDAPPSQEDEPDAYADWQGDVRDAFFGEYSRPAPQSDSV